ncbi:hypothetical protein, partial [Evtepia sp.]
GDSGLQHGCASLCKMMGPLAERGKRNQKISGYNDEIVAENLRKGKKKPTKNRVLQGNPEKRVKSAKGGRINLFNLLHHDCLDFSYQVG